MVDETTNQAATASAPATATASAAAEAAAAAAPASATVTISAGDYQDFLAGRSRLAEIEAQRAREAQEARQREIEALAQKGQIENAMRMLREESEQRVRAEQAARGQIEERAKRYALDGELSRALAAQSLVPHAAEQLAALWRGQFTVEAQGDSFTVRTPTFQSVPDFIAQQLARPEYAHFMRAGTAGGSGGQAAQAAQTQAATPSPSPAPRNMGEAVILHMQSLKKAQGDPRGNMELGFGLRAPAKAQ
jgi:hypothetical protein